MTVLVGRMSKEQLGIQQNTMHHAWARRLFQQIRRSEAVVTRAGEERSTTLKCPCLTIVSTPSSHLSPYDSHRYNLNRVPRETHYIRTASDSAMVTLTYAATRRDRIQGAGARAFARSSACNGGCCTMRSTTSANSVRHATKSRDDIRLSAFSYVDGRYPLA